MRAPRALACSYSSSTSTPAPSPRTKPSRSRSNGRLAEAGQAGRAGARFGAAGDEDFGVAVLDHAQGGADGVDRGGAGADRGEVGAGDAEVDGNVPRHHVDDAGRHEEGRDPTRSFFVQLATFLLYGADASDARTHADADAVAVGVGDRQA